MRARKFHRAPDVCACGQTYADFRTHLTFAEVRRQMWNPDPDPKEGRWRRRSRRYVLGFWHEIKLSMWWSTHGGCEMSHSRSASDGL